MMGIFKKRDSKSSSSTESKSDKSSRYKAIATERILDYSHKSPKLINDKFNLPAMAHSVPNITIPSPPNPQTHPAAYLRSIHAVRDRTKLVLEEAKVNGLNHFDVDISKFKDTAEYVVSIIKVRVPINPLS